MTAIWIRATMEAIVWMGLTGSSVPARWASLVLTVESVSITWEEREGREGGLEQSTKNQ